jgi:hypothetical protein
MVFVEVASHKAEGLIVSECFLSQGTSIAAMGPLAFQTEQSMPLLTGTLTESETHVVNGTLTTLVVNGTRTPTVSGPVFFCRQVSILQAIPFLNLSLFSFSVVQLLPGSGPVCENCGQQFFFSRQLCAQLGSRLQRRDSSNGNSMCFNGRHVLRQ